MRVPFYDNSREIKQLTSAIYDVIPTMLNQQTLVNGDQVKRLESDIQRYTGIKNAVAVGNATDGLIICLMAAGIGPSDEVIVPCYSFFATVSCILHVGAKPVFVDIDPNTYALDVDQVERAIGKKTKAIIPVHLFNQMADMPRLRKLAADKGLILIEDSAEAIAMWQNNQHAGSFGLGGVFSFFPTKTLGALGDAGMIVSNDDEFAARCRMIANLGRDENGIAQVIGLNSRMDDWHAVVLRARLSVLSEGIKNRETSALLLNAALASIDGIIKLPTFNSRGYKSMPIYYVYLMEVEKRDELAKYLADSGIVTETYYPLPLHLQPICRHLGYSVGDFPNAEKSSSRALALPMHAELHLEQIEYIVDTIKRFYQRID